MVRGRLLAFAALCVLSHAAPMGPHIEKGFRLFFPPEGEELFQNMTRDEHKALEEVRREVRAEVKNGSIPTPDDFKAKIEAASPSLAEKFKQAVEALNEKINALSQESKDFVQKLKDSFLSGPRDEAGRKEKMQNFQTAYEGLSSAAKEEIDSSFPHVPTFYDFVTSHAAGNASSIVEGDAPPPPDDGPAAGAGGPAVDVPPAGEGIAVGEPDPSGENGTAPVEGGPAVDVGPVDEGIAPGDGENGTAPVEGGPAVDVGPVDQGIAAGEPNPAGENGTVSDSVAGVPEPGADPADAAPPVDVAAPAGGAAVDVAPADSKAPVLPAPGAVAGGSAGDQQPVPLAPSQDPAAAPAGGDASASVQAHGAAGGAPVILSS